MGRPKEFKVEEALARAMEAFREQGYDSTTFEHLIQCTGIQKASLYATFGDKRALFMHALRMYHEDLSAKVRELLARPGPVSGKLRAFLAEPSTLDSEGKLVCCLWVKTQLEISTRDPEIAKFQREFYDSLHEQFAAALEQGVRQGEFRSDLNTNSAAHLLLSTVAGLYVVTRSGIQDDEWAPVLDAFIQTLR